MRDGSVIPCHGICQGGADKTLDYQSKRAHSWSWGRENDLDPKSNPPQHDSDTRESYPPTSS